MRPAFIIALAVLLFALSPAGLPRQGVSTASEVLPYQSSQLKNADIPGAQADAQKTKSQITALLGNLPLYFVENKGQLDGQVKYYTKAQNGSVYFTGEEIVYQFFISDQDKNGSREKPFPTDISKSIGEDSAVTFSTPREETIRVSFKGANNKARIEAQGEQEAKFSYFRGNDPQKWVSGARSFQKIAYRDLYPGINSLSGGWPNEE
jgi:hypothetical protein